MVSESEIVTLIQEAKKGEKERKFKESLELYITLKDIDVKKGFALNEVIQLPNQMSKPAAVCVMASGDMGLKAKDAKADEVMDNDGLDRLAQDKRASRKFINKYDFFLADTKLMPLVGKSLGQLLGPRGKMPTPVPFNAPIESFLERFRASVKIRAKGSLSMSCRIGEENMDDADLAANA
ncbi:MAG: 50S ribosomal protein L1, partial [Candidatus Nitrosopelagicus sp.]|nr:50S ribosomal protein L1 [Candidatus Nitrosopelagicus sp.]